MYGWVGRSRVYPRSSSQRHGASSTGLTEDVGREKSLRVEKSRRSLKFRAMLYQKRARAWLPSSRCWASTRGIFAFSNAHLTCISLGLHPVTRRFAAINAYADACCSMDHSELALYRSGSYDVLQCCNHGRIDLKQMRSC